MVQPHKEVRESLPSYGEDSGEDSEDKAARVVLGSWADAQQPKDVVKRVESWKSSATEFEKKVRHAVSKGLQQGPISRAVYRKQLIELGVIHAKDDVDVFHIIANANGGADHTDNFLIALGKTFNRSNGDRLDGLHCYIAGLAKTTRAVAASVKFGTKLDPRDKPVKRYKHQHPERTNNDEKEAAYLVSQGQSIMNRVKKMGDDLVHVPEHWRRKAHAKRQGSAAA